MKTLLLLRHARPTAHSPTGRDFDRPLAAAGRDEARLVGQFLRREALAPDLLVCSPAARARETAALVAGAALFPAATTTAARFDERIYDATAERLLEVVSEAAGDAGVVLVVGHNPGLAELILLLTGESASVAPATLARVELDIARWDEARAATGRLIFALAPGETGGEDA